jgi:hypothetical protein
LVVLPRLVVPPGVVGAALVAPVVRFALAPRFDAEASFTGASRWAAPAFAAEDVLAEAAVAAVEAVLWVVFAVAFRRFLVVDEPSGADGAPTSSGVEDSAPSSRGGPLRRAPGVTTPCLPPAGPRCPR